MKVRAFPRALEDIFYDPQTSGGLADRSCRKRRAGVPCGRCRAEIPNAAQIGYVTELHENYLILE